MEQLSRMLRSYLMRFVFRALVLLTVLYTYLTNRSALDFTKNTRLLHPINLLWLIFILSFAAQLSPKSRVSRGCLKQFPAYFDKIEAAVDDLRVRTRLSRLDLGATRVALAWTVLNLYVADDPDLRFTWVPKLPGHDKETLEIFNNTTHDITSRVRNVRTGETFEVTVKAGGVLCR